MHLQLILLFSTLVVSSAHFKDHHGPTMFEIASEFRYPFISSDLVRKGIQHFIEKYGEYISPEFLTEMKDIQKPENNKEIEAITNLWGRAISGEVKPPQEPRAAMQFYKEQLPLLKDRITRLAQVFEAKYNNLDSEAQQFLNKMDEKLHDIDDITDQTTTTVNMFHFIVETDKDLQLLSDNAKKSLREAWPQTWSYVQSDKYKKRMLALAKLDGKPEEELIDGLGMLFVKYTIEDEYGIDTGDF